MHGAFPRDVIYSIRLMMGILLEIGLRQVAIEIEVALYVHWTDGRRSFFSNMTTRRDRCDTKEDMWAYLFSIFSMQLMTQRNDRTRLVLF